jgi:hypothetical protein
MIARAPLPSKGLRLAAALAALVSAGCAAGVTTQGEGLGGAGQGGSDSTSGGGQGAQGGATATSTSATTGSAGGSSGECVDASDCAAYSGPCTQGACVNGACAAFPANEFGACDDGLFCTENEHCQEGACVSGSARYCPTSTPCHIGACDEAADACVDAPGNDGSQCDDGNACTYTGICSGGACTPGAPIDCTALDGQCTVGVCQEGVGCVAAPANAGIACNDGFFCTVNETCQNGVCGGGSPNPCAPPGGCFVSSCDEATDTCSAVPGNDGAACDDFNVCTKNTTCLAGVCTFGQPDNDGMACDDGTDCTMGELCAAGICGGGVGPEVYFSEDFSDNAAGWVLGPEWEIGPAEASFGGVFGADPDTDHSPSADNGVAGVVIGGNASTNLHGFYYLESPAFDTSFASGAIILGFYRWLNSDYDPFMHNNIQVYNGAQWVEIWKSGPAPGIEDSPPNGQGWTFIEHDLTAFKSAAMRVRFGFDITSQGVFTIGSWNIDDVLVAGAACP